MVLQGGEQAFLPERFSMTLFVGGPYDGHDLPVDPDILEHIRLPTKGALDAFLHDTLSSTEGMTPHLYSADKSSVPAVFRFVRSSKPYE